MKKMIIFLVFAAVLSMVADAEAGWKKRGSTAVIAVSTVEGSYVSGRAHVDITGSGKKSVDVRFTGGTVGPDGTMQISGGIQGTTTDDFVAESSSYVVKEIGEPPVGGTDTYSSSPDVTVTASWSYTPLTTEQPSVSLLLQQSHVSLRGAWNW